MKVRVCHGVALAWVLVAGEASAQTMMLAQPVPWTPQPRTSSWAIPTLHAVGLFAAQRIALSVLWTEAFSFENTSFIGAQARLTWTAPPRFDSTRPAFEWDGDRWTINVIGHGLMGSELYLRARQCSHSVWASLGFAAVASAGWEYRVEGWHVQPSGYDLVWTPLAGMAIGELRYAVYRWAGRFRRVARTVVRAVVDPFGEAERALGAGC